MGTRPFCTSGEIHGGEVTSVSSRHFGDYRFGGGGAGGGRVVTGLGVNSHSSDSDPTMAVRRQSFIGQVRKVQVRVKSSIRSNGLFGPSDASYSLQLALGLRWTELCRPPRGPWPIRSQTGVRLQPDPVESPAGLEGAGDAGTSRDNPPATKPTKRVRVPDPEGIVLIGLGLRGVEQPRGRSWQRRCLQRRNPHLVLRAPALDEAPAQRRNTLQSRH